MKVDISSHLEPDDGPLMIELETVLAHRVVFSLDGKAFMDNTVRGMLCLAMAFGREDNKTAVDIFNPLPEPVTKKVNLTPPDEPKAAPDLIDLQDLLRFSVLLRINGRAVMTIDVRSLVRQCRAHGDGKIAIIDIGQPPGLSAPGRS